MTAGAGPPGSDTNYRALSDDLDIESGCIFGPLCSFDFFYLFLSSLAADFALFLKLYSSMMIQFIGEYKRKGMQVISRSGPGLN